MVLSETAPDTLSFSPALFIILFNTAPRVIPLRFAWKFRNIIGIPAKTRTISAKRIRFFNLPLSFFELLISFAINVWKRNKMMRNLYKSNENMMGVSFN